VIFFLLGHGFHLRLDSGRWIVYRGHRQIAGCDNRACGDQDAARYEIFEFPDIARPLMVYHRPEDWIGESADLFPLLPAVLREEVSGQQGNVFFAIPKGRNLHAKDV